MKEDFPWPPILPHSEKPYWTGHGFRIGEEIKAVLAYTGGVSGWSDELTDFQEETAGADHFMDVSSRQHALGQIRKRLFLPLPIILEIGCSSGFMLHLIRQSLPEAFLIGSDIISGPLLRLATKMPDIPLLQFDLTRCPLPDQSVDIVLMLNVLEHIREEEAALRHVHRILKPGGAVIIEVPAGSQLYDLYDQFLGHHRRYSKDSLAKLLRKFDFRILELSHLGFFIYPGFWLVKKRNHRRLKGDRMSVEEIVEKEIRQTGNSLVLSTLMKIELALGKWISFPWGIRLLATCLRE
jgi:ubiquinone/menaquinone biosynthesis C-methylase UbiE